MTYSRFCVFMFFVPAKKKKKKKKRPKNFPWFPGFRICSMAKNESFCAREEKKIEDKKMKSPTMEMY